MPLNTPLQVLVVYAKGPLSKAQLGSVEAALKDAGKTLGLICNDLHICGVVGLEEDIPLPQGIGYNEDQDYLDTSNTNYDKIGKLRDRFLEASDYKVPKYVLFVTPAGDMANTTNAYSMRGGYCSVVRCRRASQGRRTHGPMPTRSAMASGSRTSTTRRT